MSRILIEFVSDSSGLATGIDDLEKLGLTDKQNAEQFKKTKALVDSYGKAVTDASNKATKATNETKLSLDKLHKGFTETGKSVTGVFGKDLLSKLINEVPIATDEVEQLKQAVVNAKLALNFTDNAQDIKEIENAIAAAETALQQFGSGGTKSLRTELRQSREELAKMLVDGKLNTSQIYQMAKAGGNLKDAIGDAGQAINVLSSDTFALDAGIQTIQSLTAGFQLAQGAVALFGTENEELQKTLVKLNALMAINSALQQLQNNLQKQTAQSLGLNILMQKAYSIAVGTSTGAMKLFRLALVSTGIGAIVVLIATLIANFDKVKEAIVRIFPGLNKLGTLFNSFKSIVVGAFKGIQAGVISFAENTFQTVVKWAGGIKDVIVGAFTLDFNKIKKGATDFLGSYKDLFLDNFVKLGKDSSDAFAKGKAGQDKINLKKEAISLLGDQIEKNQFEIDKLKAQGNDLKAAFKELDNTKKQAQVAQLELDLDPKNKEKQKALNDEIINVIAAQKSLNDALKSEADKSESNRKEQQQKALDAKKQAISDEIAILETQRIKAGDNAEKLLEIDKNLIKKRAELSKLDAKTKPQLNLIDAKSLQDEEQLIKEYLEKIKQLALDAERKIYEDAKTIDDARINEKLANINLSGQEEYNLRVQLLENQKELDELAIAQSTEAEEIKIAKLKEINTKFQSDKLAILKSTLDAELQYTLALYDADTKAQKDALDNIIKNEKLSFEQRKQAVEELSKVKLDKIGIEKSALDEQLRKGLISTRDYTLKIKELGNEEIDAAQEKEQAITDIMTKEAEKRKDIMEQLKDAGFAIATEIINGVFELRAIDAENELNEKLALLNKKRDIELANTSLTESQKQAIEKRYQREENELKKRAFEQKKKADRNQAIINTAVAVTKAFADLGPIGGAIASALLLTKLGFEVATINRQKYPGFKTGTKKAPSGFKWVGEEGPELINDGGGYAIMNNKDSMLMSGLMNKYNLDNPYSKMMSIPMPKYDSKTTDILQKHIVEKTIVRDSGIDIDKMAKSFASEVAKNPAVSINVDKNGFETFLINKNSKIKNTNNYV